jgi:hypothetical protein
VCRPTTRPHASARQGKRAWSQMPGRGRGYADHGFFMSGHRSPGSGRLTLARPLIRRAALNGGNARSAQDQDRLLIMSTIWPSVSAERRAPIRNSYTLLRLGLPLASRLTILPRHPTCDWRIMRPSIHWVDHPPLTCANSGSGPDASSAFGAHSARSRAHRVRCASGRVKCPDGLTG